MYDLSVRLSKKEVVVVAKLWVEDNDHLKNNVSLLQKGSKIEIENTLWILRCLYEKRSPQLSEFFPEILTCHNKNIENETIRRQCISIFEYAEIPQKLEGEIFDIAFNNILAPFIPIAIRAFSITVAYKIALKNNDLLPETLFVVKEAYDRYAHQSAAIKSRTSKILAKN